MVLIGMAASLYGATRLRDASPISPRVGFAGALLFLLLGLGIQAGLDPRLGHTLASFWAVVVAGGGIGATVQRAAW